MVLLIKCCRYILRSMEYGQILKTDKCKCRKVQLLNDDQCMFGLWADTIIFYCIKIKYVVCQCSTPTYSIKFIDGIQRNRGDQWTNYESINCPDDQLLNDDSSCSV